jgi:glucose-6-phosphate dehydrogenase assembly protein OpcA
MVVDGPIAPAPGAPGQPVLRWQSRARSIDGVAAELARIWGSIWLTAPGEDGGAERRVAARSSVMNLVVIAGRGEVGERAAAIIEGLTGRHPSRTVIVSQADPDGPAWIDAQIQAHCVLPSDTAPETCSELVYLTCGGEAGQHLAGLVAPLLIHDLPVTAWWPNEPHFEARSTQELLSMADRVIIDGAGWAGDGIDRLVEMARLPRAYGVEISDFALIRQVRWREAIASTFDRPALLPYVNHLDRIEVRYAASDGTPGMTNIVRPLYHVAWLAARLGMVVEKPFHPGAEPWTGYDAILRHGRQRIPVGLRPMEATAPRGTTVTVELHAMRGHSQLWVEVTAFADGVVVQASLDAQSMRERRFLAPRKREPELLAETIDDAGHDELSTEILAMAAKLLDR